MSRLTIMTATKAQRVIEDLYKDLERRIIASPPGLCPVDMASAFLKLCHAQTCGKCVPCRVGLAQLQMLLEDVLEGRASPVSYTHLCNSLIECICNGTNRQIGRALVKQHVNRLAVEMCIRDSAYMGRLSQWYSDYRSEPR